MPVNSLRDRREAARPSRRLELLTKTKDTIEARQGDAAKKLDRATHARMVIDNPVIQEFFDSWDNTAFTIFREADPGDTNALMAARYMDVIMNLFKDSMRNLVNTGKHARLDTEKLRKQLLAVNRQRENTLHEADVA